MGVGVGWGTEGVAEGETEMLSVAAAAAVVVVGGGR